jgi:hypothetical protein
MATEPIDKYYKTAKQYCTKIGVESQHISNIIASVMMTRDKVLRGGGFVCAVVDNDLYSAVCRADNECQRHLINIVQACHNCFIDDYVPDNE